MTYRPLTTPEDCAQAFEKLVARARQHAWLALPHLTPDTPLTTPELRERGLEDWADLLALVTRRGVSLRLLMPDSDAVLTPQAHRAAWGAASGLADVVQGDAQVICAAHGQRVTGLWAWRLRRRYKDRLAALQAEEPARLTMVQRSIASGDTVFRPVNQPQSFAVADDAACVIGGPDVALAIEDRDFCGALRAHFADSWQAALEAGAHSLAAPAVPLEMPRRPQSRADLRLLRSLSRPAPGFGPRPVATDHETVLARLFEEARKFVLIHTQAFRHDGLAAALATAAARSPDLQLVLLLPEIGPESWDEKRAASLQAQVIKTLGAAFGTRLSCVAAPGIRTSAIVIDDEVALVGSASMTRRACRWNTEASALVHDPALATDLLNRIGARHLGTGTTADNLRRADTWAATCTPFITETAPGVRCPLPDDLF